MGLPPHDSLFFEGNKKLMQQSVDDFSRIIGIRHHRRYKFTSSLTGAMADVL